MYSILLALIYLAFISLGLPDSLLGAGWPVMHTDLNVPISYMGIVSMVISGGTIISSLFSDRLTKKIGTRIVTAISVFLTAIALFGFSFSDSFWLLIVFSVPYGLGAGAIDAALNNYVALHYTSKHMSWLHCFWGVGTIVSPFVMSYAISNSVWNNGYRIVAFIQLGICLILFATLSLWNINKKTNVSVEKTKSIGIIGALKIRGVPQLLTGFFAYCAAEATAMYWASTYMVEVKGVLPELAARFASLFFIGLTLGRFVGGFIMNKLGDRKMINFGTVVLFCGIISLFIPWDNPSLSVAGFVIIGLGCAPIYPCIIHSTPTNFGANNSGAIIGIQMASAYLGTTLVPPLFGLLGNSIGFRILPVYLSIFVILMIIMVELTFKITEKNNSIRRAIADDIPAISEIYKKIHTLEKEGLAHTGWISGVYPTEDTANAALERNDLFVFDDGQIRASAIINQTQVDVYNQCKWKYSAEDSKVMVLHTLTVDPGSGGRGIGSSFVSFYEKYAKQNGCTVLRMDTNAINTAARKLYKKIGYREAEILPCDFNGIPGINLVMLEKKL